MCRSYSPAEVLYINHASSRSRHRMHHRWDRVRVVSVSRGIGVLPKPKQNARCEEFAERGCKVYATSRNVDTMKGFREGIEQLALDVTSDEEVQKVVDHIVKVEGRIDIAVNNGRYRASS